jgi:hypothetical protein
MRRNLLALMLVNFSTSMAGAQPSIDPPVVGRPIEFSNIVGRYMLKASAAPTKVHVEDSIRLTIEIVGEGPVKYEPKRSDLKVVLPSWEKDFYVQPMPAEDRVLPSEKTWVFVYRLKPKHVNVTAIPLMTLHYFVPNQPVKSQFQKSYAGPIPLTVAPRPDDPAPIEVRDTTVPDSFYERASSDDVMQSQKPIQLNLYLTVAWLAPPPLLCVVAVWAYRRYRLDPHELARRQRSEAASRAIAQLGSQPAWEVVERYLRERFDFAVLDATPAEVATFLNRRGFAKALCGQSRAFFETCDAVRFTRTHVPNEGLVNEAERLIHALEADPCARS